jgi:hypothetical protein
MRKLKSSGNHLRNQTWKNLGKAALCLILFGLIFFPITLNIVLTFHIDLVEEVVLLASLVPLAGFYIYLRRYRIYSGGLEGERQVVNLLRSTLSDDYYLINGVHFPRGGGDIDHVVLGPNGIFAIETKNWRGWISCSGDTWQRGGKRIVGSPSEQAKKNAAKVRRAVEASGNVPFSVWVDAIVVFTNNHADLHLNGPTVAVVKLHQLPNYIIMHQNRGNRYTIQQLEFIGKEIIKQTRQ